MQNNRFIGYKSVSESHLRSADCLCYKLFPSIQDVVFNYKKNVEYLMFASLRIGFENHHRQKNRISFKYIQTNIFENILGH